MMSSGPSTLPLLSLILAAGCGSVSSREDPDANVVVPPDAEVGSPDAPASDPFVNGSFEQDYLGWTLDEDSGVPEGGAWAIGADGDVLTGTSVVHDFFDNVDLTPPCLGVGTIPTLDATDGTRLAFNVQGGPERHRIWQDITIPASLTTLSWSMSYITAATFDLTAHFLGIEVRDPDTDAITTTLFTTDPLAAPPQSIAMTPFSADLSAFAGQTVRITVDLQAQSDCFFATFDGFRLE
jgi:hypothetical protein